MLLLDQALSKEADHFKPHKSTFDINNIRTVAGNLSIPKPVVATISARLERDADFDGDQSQMDVFLCE